MRYRLNKAETAPVTIHNVAVTKSVGGREIVSYSNYIRLVPGKVYESDDEAMLGFFRAYRRKVRHTEALERNLRSNDVPYEIEYCKSCGGKVRKISYQVVEVYDE